MVVFLFRRICVVCLCPVCIMLQFCWGPDYSELLSAQYLARCLEPDNVYQSITTMEPHKRRMKEILFARHHNTVEPMMIADDRKATLQAIYTDAVNKAANSQEMNVVLVDCPPPINNMEKDLTRKERATLSQLRSGYYGLLGSYKSRIKKDECLNLCWIPHDVKHCFVSPAYSTTLTLEQTNGLHLGTQLSYSERPRLR